MVVQLLSLNMWHGELALVLRLPTDTTLFTEVLPRVSGTTSQVTTSTTNDTFQVVGTQTAGTTETITNAGLFDASTSGNLFIKGDFTGVPLSTR